MINRRSHRRTKVQRRVEIEPLETGRRTGWILGSVKSLVPAEGKVLDIGVGGMCGEFPTRLNIGTPCNVRIEGPDGQIQRTRGTVRNVRGQKGTRQIGISFNEPLVTLGDPTSPGTDIGVNGVAPRALVVDDEPGVRTVLQRYLEGRGFVVETAPDGNSALEWLRHHEPALMIVDLKMPGLTGVQLLETMNAENLHVPNIWAMSAYVSDQEALTALSLGAAEFINKPFDLDHLDFTLGLMRPLL